MTNIQIDWDQDASKHLEKAPFFIRKFARKKVEKAAKEQGLTRITVEFVEKIRNKESSL